MAVLTVTDITERKRSEEELRLSAERLNRAQEIAHLGSWEVELATNRLIWSDEVYRIFGLQPQEFEGSYDDFLEAIHPNDRAAVDAAYTHSLINGSNTYEIEHRVVRRGTGEVRIVHERCEHMRDESGRLIRSVGMVHDITERKRNEEDLRLAKEAAETATRTKSQFLANMSHELRTPMTGVLGMLELTLADDLSPGQRSNLLVVKKSADALLRILNDILDFSRIEAGMLTILEEPLHLSGCVRDIAEFFTLEARQKGLQLIQEIDPDIPELILGDEGRIRQVLINLMANAIKFTERGKLTLRVKTGELDDKGRRLVTFTVADTGIGISLQQQELLFQPFSQADLSHSRRYQGSGLGLAISKEIVQHM
jgi:PAS domain S-box-containing protein